jgi:hypothetical protein
MLRAGSESRGLAMKMLQIEPRGGTHLYGAMIQEAGRDPARRTRDLLPCRGAQTRRRARWTHVRYKGSVALEPGASDAVNVEIKSPERGDEARLLSSFLGWLDRHFSDQLSSVSILYAQRSAKRPRH